MTARRQEFSSTGHSNFVPSVFKHSPSSRPRDSHPYHFVSFPGPYCRSISTDSEESEDDEFELRPLIKEELRNSIQKRRWQMGLIDWGLEDYDKKRGPKDNKVRLLAFRTIW